MATKGVTPFAGKESKKEESKEKQVPPWLQKKKFATGGTVRGTGAAVRGKGFKSGSC